MHRRFRFFFFLPAVIAFVFAACDNGTTSAPAETDIVSVLSVNEDYASFSQALVATGLDATLRSGGPYTVLAPTDLAFEFLGMDTVDRLFDPQNSNLLERILRFHIVPGRFFVADLEAGVELQTLEGTTLVAERIDGELRIGGALISDADVEADNGLIQGISEVLRMNLDTADRLRLTPILETFSNLVATTGASDYLAEQSQVTVFAPINNAFVDFGDPEFTSLTDPANVDVLNRIVDFHIAEGLLDLSMLNSGSEITTRDGSKLTLTVEGNARYLNGRPVVSEPIETANGLIYLLNGVQQDSLNLEERLRTSPRLSTFSDLVAERADLVSFLSSDSEYTVFAPLNIAYEAFPSNIREAIFRQENVALLDQLTRVHIVPGGYTSADLTDGLTLVALDGTELEVQVGGSNIFVGGRLLDQLDGPVERGAFHQVALLITPTVSIMDKLLLAGFANQLDAIGRAGSDSFFRGDGPFTMFAFPDELYTANPGLLGRSDLDQILLYHAAATVVGPLEHGLLFQSIEGTNRTIAYDGATSTFRLDGIGGLLDYGSLLNGHLYSVDALTLPPILRVSN
ncbi:MAG: fasciclin domain-containing protein [Chloroflexi bacterium]|nr:fasciclin domain-containing protein [Chloroflexota bacterium]